MFPLTVRALVGFVVPMPTPFELILTFSFADKVPPAKNEIYLFELETPIEKLESELYKYPSNAPLIVQVDVENPLLLIPKSI